MIQIKEAGIEACTASKSLQDLGMSLARVIQYVEQNPSDAWIVSAASHEINEWFSQQSFPALAVYGSFSELPIASVFTSQIRALNDCMERLVSLGHKRMVMFTREERRISPLPPFERKFLSVLKANGLLIDQETHLPDWEESHKGLRACLEKLFKQNPPTALFFQEPQFASDAQQNLRHLGIQIPKDVSLYCTQHSPIFNWIEPPIAHSRWDENKVIERILSWARKVANQEIDLEQIMIDAEYVDSTSIGPAPH